MEREQFVRILRDRCLVEPGATVLCACSGGADSVALLMALASVKTTYPLQLLCVHVEHGIRGEASRQDAAFVRELCNSYGIPFFLYSVDVPAVAEKDHAGIEATARKLRYQALVECLEREDGSVIALAHHRRDQVETVLMHLLRGCDTDALTGMQWRENRLIRPFLDTEPETLKAYLTESGIAWREDGSNQDITYTRNRIRYRVLPELKKAYPGAETAIIRLSMAAARDSAFFRQQVQELELSRRTCPFPGGTAIPADVLRRCHPAVASRAVVELIRMSGLPAQNKDRIESVLDLVYQSDDRAQNLEGDGRARLWHDLLILVGPLRAEAYEYELCHEYQMIPDAQQGNRFHVRPAGPGETGDGRHSQVIPAALLEDARVVYPREGMPFVPFGKRNSSTTVLDFLSKVPLPAEIRCRIPVLISREGEVLWIAGVRPSERVRSDSGDKCSVAWTGSAGMEKILEGIRRKDWSWLR